MSKLSSISRAALNEKEAAHYIGMSVSFLQKDRTTITGSFMGWTRRIIAMTVPFLIIALVVIAIYSLMKGITGVSIPTSVDHRFLFGLFSWTSHSVVQLSGLVWMPWFKLWFFMIGGFYFGRIAVK